MDPAERAAEIDSAGRSTSTRLPPGDFGVVLATLRARRGWSVREFARRAHVSEGQICNLESGVRNPTPAVAAACDAAFGTGGQLVELAGAGRRGARTEGIVEAGSLVSGYERVLWELKDIGRSTGPRFVTASMKSITRILTDAGPHAVGGQRAEIWLLASRFAEYTGWMAQEAGNPAEALRWTNLAVRWGAHGGDETVAAYALVRKAFIAQHRGDTDAAIGFADQAAGHPAANPVIRAHAARRAAQGHARRGDAGACREALERFRSHAAEVIGDRTPHWGPRIENGNLRLIEASCMLSLRRFELAAELFAAERRRWPAVPSDSNSQARFAVRQATSLAGAGRLDGACQIVEATLPVIKRIDSATVRAELGHFVEQARTWRAGPGQLALIDASASLAIG
ncbi:helix-turn-helix transcriptional regulator [Streptomyces sp. HNM0663]|uniref:Helix-turn-helix transcriptional regulator n=1 Tax=Streptomyces chengmaiensis TaxID=3040919 RepID=A0ABT6HQM3_9ACTN|nr:helix-turn-helix transcriptional regulator [Streptomyces chengmaiensis]MDH2390587.1 helix-turn-helix transcriptional regulator [Streptomyces chengmaiensis]